MKDIMPDTENLKNLSLAPEEEQVPPPIDAVIHITISPNNLEAYLNIEPPVNGGNPPTLEKIENVLSGSRVTYGIDKGKLKEISENPIYNSDIIIAKGVQATNGVDGTYALHFNPEKDMKPKERPDGTVDYQDLGIVENVKKGQTLCTITLPKDGMEGMTVTGKRIMPINGKPVPHMVGKNAKLNEQGTVIYSTINGQVEYKHRKITVSETFYVKENVDNSTGNIKVNGNVKIKGMVLSGFVVEAEGNIDIGGTVESAKIKAGGNLILRSGINGSEIVCGGDMTSRFIENCNVIIKGAAKSEYIMNSNIRCGKSLQIIGSLARITGGSFVIGQDLITPIIGSSMGAKTYLELGTDPSVIERQQEILKEIPVLEKQIKSLSQLISLLKQYEAANRLDSEKKGVLDEALYNYEANMSTLESDNEELKEIDEMIVTKGYGRIQCKRTIYPGTFVKIGEAKLSVSEPLNNVILYNDNDKIGQISAC